MIPLSKGTNIIIGDNSIGKSMILHAITGFEKGGEKRLPNGVKNSYKGYIKKNNLKIRKQIDQTKLFAFGMQGEVRSKFEKNKLNTSELLSKYFPKDVKLQIQSGALEYVCPEYSVLEIVADNIDGGLELIQKRQIMH